MTTNQKVCVLFAREDSVYKTFQDCDVWDIERDARNYSGNCPIIAHPPCRAWGRLRHMAKPRPDEKELAIFAVEIIRKNGGILEHPAGSTLWPRMNLPAPGASDCFGGFTFPVDQNWFGHRARKRTLLYIVGTTAANLPTLPFSIAPATHVIGTSLEKKDGSGDVLKPTCTHAERERTPIAFAEWLIAIAKSTTR